MTPEELEHEISELEHRLERLRALYEQYFLGIEKIEPHVARKDVDRRFWALRKIKIRNTARRFKLQTLIQRYNTFQQHWARICREIENGTYRRQLLRAERREAGAVGTARSVAPGADTARAASEREAAATDLAALMDEEIDLAAEAKRALAAVMAPRAAAPAAPERAAQHTAPSAPQASAPRAAPPPRAERSQPLDALELDDLDLGPAPKRAPAPSRPQAAPAPRAPVPGAAHPLSGAARPPATPGAARPMPVAALGGARPPARPAAASPQAVRPPVPATASPQAVRPPVPGAARPPAVRPPLPGAAQAPAARPPVPARPAPAQAPAARPPAPARPSPGASRLSDERVNQLHANLVAAKKQLGEAAQVSRGGLQRQLEASMVKLQEKHQGRKIDFEVVVREGKAVVKPKVG